MSQSPPTPLDSLDAVNDMFDLAAPPLQQPVVARLTALGGGELESIELRQDDARVVLGRGKELRPPHRVTVSGKLSAAHCELRVDPVTLRVTVTDTSTNGTFVNGARVAKGAAQALQTGDHLSLTRPARDPDAAAADAAESVEYVFQRLREETTASKLEEELTCGICRGLYHRPCTLLPCMHVFCAGCISRWTGGAGGATCPECRTPAESIRPTHKIQGCVDQLLAADPSKRRPEEELRALDADDTVPPTGKVLGSRKRQRDSGSGSERGSGADSDLSDDDYSGSDGSDLPGVQGLRVGQYQRGAFGQPAAPQRCRECDTPSSVDQFQCVPGGPHLRCARCGSLFPERPLCGRAQRCGLCSTPFCCLYYPQPGACEGAMKPLRMHEMSVLPTSTFGGNTTEQAILTTYLAGKQILVGAVWQECLQRLAAGEWTPDIVSIQGPLTADTPVCAGCAAKAFAALLFHYRRAIPSDDLPESVTRRSNCWYGVQCRTQFHKLQHAQNYNHVCYQEKRKE